MIKPQATQEAFELSDFIKGLRSLEGESQETFGARFGVTKQAVSAWERGEYEPPAIVLVWAMMRHKRIKTDRKIEDIDWTR